MVFERGRLAAAGPKEGESRWPRRQMGDTPRRFHLTNTRVEGVVPWLRWATSSKTRWVVRD